MDISNLTTEQIPMLTLEDIQSLTTEQIQSLAPEKLAYFHNKQLIAMLQTVVNKEV